MKTFEVYFNLPMVAVIEAHTAKEARAIFHQGGYSGERAREIFAKEVSTSQKTTKLPQATITNVEEV